MNNIALKTELKNQVILEPVPKNAVLINRATPACVVGAIEALRLVSHLIFLRKITPKNDFLPWGWARGAPEVEWVRTWNGEGAPPPVPGGKKSFLG